LERREKASKVASCAIRKLKPTQYSSGPNLIDSASCPFLPRRIGPASPLPRAIAFSGLQQAAPPADSWISNYIFTKPGIRLDTIRVGCRSGDFIVHDAGRGNRRLFAAAYE
jgi:hypothetical protein